jgi:hypothetical protein
MGQDDEDGEDRRAVMTAQGGSSADYAAEIRNAIRYERALAVKAVIPLALVGLIIGVYRILHG